VAATREIEKETSMQRDRRSFLRAGAGGLGLAVMGGARRALGDSRSPVTIDGYPRVDAPPKPPAPVRDFKVLEIFLLGGLSPWETLYIREEGAPWAAWRGGQPDFDALAGPPSAEPGDSWFGRDSAGHDIFIGRPVAPLLRHAHRMRTLVMRSPLGDDAPHELAVPFALTGQTVGNPRAAGLGAAIQQEWLERPDVDHSMPHSYVLASSRVNEAYLAAAASVGGYVGEARPVVLKISERGAGEGPTLARLLERPSAAGPGHDGLLAYYQRRYQDALTSPRGPTRSKAMVTYSSGIQRLLGAPRLASLVGDPVAAPVPAPFTPAETASGPAKTTAALELAATLLAAPATRHVAVLDNGFADEGYDGHFWLSALTSNGLFGTLSCLDRLITAGRIDLDSTLVVLNTEFGRTPDAQDRGEGGIGRDHHLRGYVTALLGGPVDTSASVDGGGKLAGPRSGRRVVGSFGDDGVAVPALEIFRPSDLLGAAILAAGGDPLRREGFATSDFGPTVGGPSPSPSTIRDNLARHVLGR
jgi:hypothetical protein